MSRSNIIPVTLPPDIVAFPVALLPLPAEKVTVGTEVYPVPPSVTLMVFTPDDHALSLTLLTAAFASAVGPLIAFSASAYMSSTSEYLNKGQFIPDTVEPFLALASYSLLHFAG